MIEWKKQITLAVSHTVGFLAAVAANEFHWLAPDAVTPSFSEYLFFLYLSLGTVAVGASYVRSRSTRRVIVTATILPAVTLWLAYSYRSIISCTTSAKLFCSIKSVMILPVFSFILYYGPLACLAAGMVAIAAVKIDVRMRKVAKNILSP